jgi:hypothetical protein
MGPASAEYGMAKYDRSELQDKPLPAVVTQPLSSMSVVLRPAADNVFH